MARHYRYMYEGKNAGCSSIHGMDQAYEREKAASKLAWQEANAKLPDDAFADDVEDDDTNPYRPNLTWVPSKSVMDM